MPQPIPSGLAALLRAVAARISLRTDIPDYRVLLCARGQIPHFQGDQDVLLQPGPPTPEDGFVSGAGRVCTVLRRVLEVIPRTRLALDSSDRDDSWLIDPTYGHLLLEEGLIDAIHLWAPLDADGNWLVVEPLRLLPYTQPEKDPDPEQRQWGSTTLRFECTYQAPLDQSFLV